MSLSSLLNDQVSLYRKTSTLDASMGVGDAWTLIGTANASVQPIKANERYVLAQRGIFLTHRIYLDADLAVDVKDKIVQVSTGLQMLVRGYFNQAGRDRVWMIEAIEQK